MMAIDTRRSNPHVVVSSERIRDHRGGTIAVMWRADCTRCGDWRDRLSTAGMGHAFAGDHECPDSTQVA